MLCSWLFQRRITNMFSSMPNCDAEQLTQPQGPMWMWWLLGAFPLNEAVQLEFISMSCVKSRLEKLQQLIRSMQSIWRKILVGFCREAFLLHHRPLVMFMTRMLSLHTPNLLGIRKPFEELKGWFDSKW